MLCVLVVAAGATWESRALGLIDEAADMMVLKRCVDVDDLMATATAGQAEAAVVALEAPGLDSDAVAHLDRYGVRVLAVASGAAGGVPEAGRLHASRLGIASVLAEGGLGQLEEALLADPDPTAVRAGQEQEQEPQPREPAAPPPVETPPGQRTQAGRMLAIWGPHGAPGRTTVACALAAEVAARQQSVVLLDADPWGGTVAQHFGVLDEVSGILSAARLSVTGTLAERFPSVQRRVGDRFSVITGLPRPDRYVEVRAGVVEHVMETARRGGHVLVDTGFSLEDDPGAEFGTRPGRNAMTRGALTAADEILVVGAADPVGLSRLARGLVEIRDLTGGQPVRVVINRNRSSLGWSEQDLARMVEGFTRIHGLHFLPEDRAAVDRALISGRSLAETGDSALRRGIADLADAVVGQAPVRRRRGGRARRR